ncbi:putative ATP-dependent RNA helicase DHX57 isoform X1 [Lates japonicus]|uniref:ATP-dependent RNA helicase DHX57 isoform X1 n=1 Tax=Lates japonicus TaxID=270547 RepID=A0AAD3MG25_LATJO|nr:putative ATP-dependent RNA helicase DHX57 isoform X1 [Lates japonicus]
MGAWAAGHGMQDLGALTADEEADPLGYHLACLPVGVRVGKLRWMVLRWAGTSASFAYCEEELSVLAGLTGRAVLSEPNHFSSTVVLRHYNSPYLVYHEKVKSEQRLHQGLQHGVRVPASAVWRRSGQRGAAQGEFLISLDDGWIRFAARFSIRWLSW